MKKAVVQSYQGSAASETPAASASRLRALNVVSRDRGAWSPRLLLALTLATIPYLLPMVGGYAEDDSNPGETAAVDESRPSASGNDSLDDSLDQALLEAELLGDRSDESAEADQDATELDQRLTRGLIDPAGEDVGAKSTEDWLARVRQSMDAARSRLAARDASGGASTAQGEVIVQLETVIARLDQQCEQCRGGQTSKSGAPKNDQQKPGSGKEGNSPGAANSPATSSQQSGSPIDVEGVRDLVKALWGRLPERQRELIMQPLSEKFLPKYAADIEDYFRALAEPQSRTR